MKIQFNPDLSYQLSAVDAIAGIFDGQQICQTNFTVPAVFKHRYQGTVDMFEKATLGIGNRLKLTDEDLLKNVRSVQISNGLPQSKALDSMNFTVEMETGTGKTYVYLRSIFELNKKYGFTKFIIVVPSIAVKEGVFKSIQITEEHLKGLYDCPTVDYFIYDSSRMGKVRDFAVSDSLQIMVINIDAFRKSFSDPSLINKANLIHREHEGTGDYKPIELIQETNPIVIIDEPQSVDNTARAKEAIKSLNPLCTLRYSATHREKYNVVYKLDAVDAYNQKLVKQIEVAPLEIDDSNNKPYVKLISVDNRTSTLKAKVQIDVSENGIVKRKSKTIKCGDDLHEKSGGRNVYSGYIVNDIHCRSGEEYIDFTSQEDVVHLGKEIGNVNDDDFKKIQIRKTIEEHLDKQIRLKKIGVKVLSLFFVDQVANYRSYDSEGNPKKGKYAIIFEEEFIKLAKKPKYRDLFDGLDIKAEALKVHNGYFSIDKKRDTNGDGVFRDTKGDSLADEDTYKLIMKDKEKLLSFDSKLQFIFSHSALREGWDNPNVFQICTLNEAQGTIRKRQEIGRGLRICVNQDGERVYGFDVNRLTVMANESYQQFVESLQREIEEDEGIKFGMVMEHSFASLVLEDEETGVKSYLGEDNSKVLYEFLKAEGYIAQTGKVTDKLRLAIKEDTLHVPDQFKHVKSNITEKLSKLVGSLNIKNSNERKVIKVNEEVFLSPEFKELWDKVKHKTTYRVDFDVDSLVEECAKAIRESLVVGRPKFRYTKADVKIEEAGVSAEVTRETPYDYIASDFYQPDPVAYLLNVTGLTRSTVIRILLNCDKLDQYKNNPQKFLEEVGKIIKKKMQHFIVDGIRYTKVGDNVVFSQELFKNEELFGYINKNMLKVDKSVYDHVVYDLGVEERFAKSLEVNDVVKVYAKLPSWFKIDTPLGTYNPDWALLVECEGKNQLYFVVETKGSVHAQDIRPKESGKIKCGKAHFEALENDVRFTVADSFDTFIRGI